MVSRKLFLICVLMIAIISGCASKVPERKPITKIKDYVTSNPSGANVYWKKKYGDDVLGPIGKTPFSRTISDEKIILRCYQVKKDGYYNSNIICRYVGEDDRHFHFDLKPIEKIITELQHSVSLTGSAGALKRITAGVPSESRPRLSPDKRWLLVQLSEIGLKASYRSILLKIDLLLGTKVILTPSSCDSREGDWLPDGSAIIFATDKMTDYTIVQSFGTAGETGVRFISDPSFGPARYPSVSPDGRNVAFSVLRSRNKNQVCVIGIDGGNLRVYGAGWEPKWSPNGSTLVFTRKVGHFTHIYAMDAQTGANLVEICAAQANDFCPTWSPNGNYLAFISDRVGNRNHLFVATANGQAVSQLTDGNFDVGSASWESDGFIYFSANAGGNWDIWKLKPKFQ